MPTDHTHAIAGNTTIQPARSGANIRVKLPSGWPGRLELSTEDNLQEPGYPDRGDILVGVNGTPAVYINGAYYGGARSFEGELLTRLRREPWFERVERGFEWVNVPPARLFWAWREPHAQPVRETGEHELAEK